LVVFKVEIALNALLLEMEIFCEAVVEEIEKLDAEQDG
jgi:hypothetical protein